MKKDNWVSVEKDKPPVDSLVLTCHESGVVCMSSTFSYMGEIHFTHEPAYGRVLYWRPKPEPPIDFYRKNFGKNLKLMRKREGITQVELGRMFGYTHESVRNWEKGLCFPNRTVLKTLAKMFECSIEEITGGYMCD